MKFAYGAAGVWQRIVWASSALFWIVAGSVFSNVTVEVLPGQQLEITLKNGATFKGAVISADERIITIQADNGSRVNIFKHIIAGIKNKTTGETLQSAGPQQAAPAQPVPAPFAPVAASGTADVPAAGQAAVRSDTVNPTVAPAAQAAKTPELSALKEPALKDTSTPPAAVHPQAATKTFPLARPSRQDTSAPPAAPAAAAGITPADSSAPTVTPAPAPSIVPVAASPAVPSPSAPSPAPALVVKPKKRADGKNELMLKNGTIFIGTIVSESDRFLSFSTSDGVTVNILRRLIKSIDGVPYVLLPGSAVAPLDTSSQLQRTAPSPAPAGGEQPKASVETKPVTAEVAPRPLPKIELKSGTSLAELIDSTKSKHTGQRAAAARRIGAMGQWASNAIPRLAALLGDTVGAGLLPPIVTDSISVQKLLSPGFEAGRALARIGPQGCDELKKQIRGDNPLVRQRATFGLGEAHYIQMQPHMQEALKDADPRVRAIAANALRFGDAIPALVEALGDADGDVRTYAAATLGEIRSFLAVKPLIGALKDVRPSVRARAAEGLMKIKSKEAVGPLAGSLADMSSEVREKAAIALGSFRDTAVVLPLLTALQDQSPGVRRSAAQALGAIRDPRAIPSLYSALNETSESVRAAVEASLKLHTDIPSLIAALDGDNLLVRENAAYILWLMTGKDLGQDKQAWLSWIASRSKEEKKPVSPEKDEKKKM